MLCLLSLGPNTPENAKNKPYRILQDHVWEKYEFVRLNDWPISMHSLRKNSHQHMHNEMGAHRMTSALKVARNDQKSKWTLTLMSIYPTLMPRWQQHCASVEHVLVSESWKRILALQMIGFLSMLWCQTFFLSNNVYSIDTGTATSLGGFWSQSSGLFASCYDSLHLKRMDLFSIWNQM